MDYQRLLEEIVRLQKETPDKGEVADYIPELKRIDPNKLGIHLITVDRSHYSAGDASDTFSIQSIAKVLSLVLAFQAEGDKLWRRVGVEPSGSAFNSLVQLEYEKGIPRNPFINAGAIVVCDVLLSCFSDPKREILEFTRTVSGNHHLLYNDKMAASEQRTGFRNHALIHFMKDFGNIHNDIDAVLDLYFCLCSLEMSCKELAESFLFLASDGVNPFTKEEVLSKSKTKRINSIMQLCGFYDEAGEFSFKVGLPGKSGVGGGIIAIHPGEYSVAVWSPKLNKKGNSYKGVKALELMTTKTQSSIF
ncbi:MAG: glutaminase [Gammaproteobacteria bacterium]|nr:glutaminase [Gammaproteobacteria bacterium]